ncbi:hypothetical protein BPAE_0046g00550 [Botrytis paeoniae]|uniref:Uncharacterized protein n=1 Tax=Botrytis paeoniae TaxID=278948 RepID=A0A4Z1FW16_9HELO|nr:hypothetical protein BPAE_0046g00550 [Botrytis paeoniae]
MGKYASMARKGKSNRGITARKPNERGGNAMYRPSFVENGVFNFVYYDLNDELRVDDEAILRMNPNSGHSKSWQGASYFFKWKKESARKGFGKEFKWVKYTGEYKDRDRLLWREAMNELNRQTADRKAAEKEWAKKVKKEELSIAKFLSQRENEILEEKRQAEMAKEATELRRTVKKLNKEAVADAREGGKAWGRSRK